MGHFVCSSDSRLSTISNAAEGFHPSATSHPPRSRL